MEKAEYLKRVKFITKFGRVLHSVGSPAHTLESTMQGMCELFGIKADIASLPTSIISSFSYHGELITKLDRVEPVGVNLGKLSRVDTVARSVINGDVTFEEGSSKLDEIMESSEDTYGRRMRVTSFLFSAAGFMVLFGGTWGDFLAAVILGIIMGCMAILRPLGMVAQLFEGIVAIVAAFMASLMVNLVPELNLGVIILSGLIIFMPGLYITIAIAEIATQNLTSGTSRLMGGVMILLKLTFGVFIGRKIASWFHFPPIEISFDAIPSWVMFITLPFTALMSTVIFKADRKDWKWVTLAGIFGFTCAKLGTQYLGPELGIFFGGACVGSAANLFARIKNRPSSLFQFPGIILLVPGSVGYRSLSFLFERNVVGGLDMAFTMVTIAMSLVVGVFVGNMFIRPRSSF